MFLNFKQILKGKQICFNNCKGKTIKDIYLHNDKGIFCIIFNDNTFFLLEENYDFDNIRSFEDTNINDSSIKDDIIINENEIKYYDLIEFFLCNGLFIKEELDKYLIPLFKEEIAKVKERELAEYKRIKEKYNL
ncbi:hypothetical protein DAC16_146 [Bacteroides phage DAC16]|nr:hypothetical protein DAC16_146 [Bacteroides phage DAC16]QIG64424.1 hypothetical protein DAC23_146 [Bacteroides phage DAC23]